MKKIFKIISQSEPITVQKQDGTTANLSTLVLQEFGGKYENSYVCTLSGNAATSKFYPGEVVLASLHFAHHVHNGNPYQDIFVQEIMKFQQ